MAIIAPSSGITLCLNRLRRTIGDDLSRSLFSFRGQLRGKKKLAKKTTTIKVRLLKDVPGFGRKGTITPIEPGRMRNSWYPRQQAEYVTAASLQGVKLQSVVAERDFTFAIQPKEDNAPKVVQQERIEVQTKLLPPLRASEIMEELLPSHIIFYRTPIPEADTQPQEQPPRPRKAASSAAADLDASSDPLPKPVEPEPVKIFGSVSTTDIAESIETLLAETAEGARIVVGAEDVTIVQAESKSPENQPKGVEGDRLKALGDFQVSARVKGGTPVIRTVSVRAQQIPPEQ